MGRKTDGGSGEFGQEMIRKAASPTRAGMAHLGPAAARHAEPADAACKTIGALGTQRGVVHIDADDLRNAEQIRIVRE
jgi:hypothetical protein